MSKKAICLSIAILAFACADSVKPIKPQVSSVSESIYASGILKSKNQYEVFSPVSGIIDTIFVVEGDTVKKGSPLFKVINDVQRLNQENAALAADFSDMRSNQGKLREAKLLIDVSRSKMQNDSLMFTRQRKLWLQQIGSKSEFEQKELAYQNSKAAYLSSIIRYNDLDRELRLNAAQTKRNLVISRRIASDYTVKSEISGIVYRLAKETGESVGTQAAVAIIGDLNNFILEMQVDEYDILKIRQGLSVQVTLDSYAGEAFEAKVTKINPIMDQQTRTFLVEAEFVNPPKKLYPNISFEANIVLATKKRAMLVPRNYVLDDSLVFKRNGEKTVVRTGLKDYQKIEILSGLSADDELILPPQ